MHGIASLVEKCTQVPTGSAKRIDTMLPAAHTDNLSVVMVGPIPWYGSSAVRHLNPVGEQARGVSKRQFPWIPSKIRWGSSRRRRKLAPLHINDSAD